MSTTKYIGLFGFGTVGQGFYEILAASAYKHLKIKKIGIKDEKKKRELASSHFTVNASELLNDPEIDIIVETIDDASAAFELVKQALENGKEVVSANKKMIAEHFSELQQIQQETGKRLLFEAAIAGSIPIVQTINSYQCNLNVKRLIAILNGSSNYILTQIFNQSWSYEKAVKEAQLKGFAETDPSLDVGGFDARYKLSLLNSFAFNRFVDVAEIPLLGIERIEAIDFEFSVLKNRVIKPLALSEKDDSGAIRSWVAPALLSSNHVLANLENELNGVVVETEFGEEQLLSGKGAGKFPTGAAVFNDLLLLLKGYNYTNQHTVANETVADKTVQLLIRTKKQSRALPNYVEVLNCESWREQEFITARLPYQKLQVFFNYASTAELFPLIDYSEADTIQVEANAAACSFAELA